MAALFSVPIWVRFGLLLLGVVLSLFQWWHMRQAFAPSTSSKRSLAAWVLMGFGLANIAYLIFLFVNHLDMPTNGVILQHIQRAATGQPIYPEPAPEFVAITYNPLYYYLAVPFTRLFGYTGTAIRLESIVGYVGIGVLVALVVRTHSHSWWWALLAVGLFAGAYRVMDTFLDAEHVDSWYLLCVTLGCHLIDRGSRARVRKTGYALALLGLLFVAISFWFKQHGAIFVAGALAFLVGRYGLARALPFAALALALVPAAYIWLGPVLFGDHFHYFTWQVGKQWTELTLQTIIRYIAVPTLAYPVLIAVSLAHLARLAWKHRAALNIWHVQFFAAAAVAFMSCLDPGSENNGFIPLGIWSIVLGCIALQRWAQTPRWGLRLQTHWLALFATWSLLVYNPTSVLAPPNARASQDDLVRFVNRLNGQVYAPWLGQLYPEPILYPAVHWVPLIDMIRGPGHVQDNHPIARQLLADALHPDNPQQPAYVLNNTLLDCDEMLHFLKQSYVLEADLGDRFKGLQGLPYRWGMPSWPRYLYRYKPNQAITPYNRAACQLHESGATKDFSSTNAISDKVLHHTANTPSTP